MTRPTASVIVPFTGAEADLEALAERLSALRTRPGDECIIADNRPDARARVSAGDVRIHPAGAIRTPGFARNRGAALATGDWLVFLDADTQPEPEHLDALLSPAPHPASAILAGAIVDVAGSGAATSVARHLTARAHMSQRSTLERGPWSYVQSANLAVRRDAFIAVGGFFERARAGEDADLCFRLLGAGYRLESRPHAQVTHPTRDSLGGLLAQLALHGSGAAWCERRYPGSFPAPPPIRFGRRLVRSGVGAAGAWVRRDGPAGTDALLDIAEALAFTGGRLLPNRPRGRMRGPAPGA